MAKQNGKKTLANKKIADGNPAEAQKPTKLLKEKGSHPDFAKNNEREAARKQQIAAENAKAKLAEFAEFVLKQRERLPDMVVGVEGKYYVSGQNRVGNFAGFDFLVTPRWFTSRDGKPGHDILVIQEAIPQEGTADSIFIFHNWLMMKPEKIPFAKGKIGEVQQKMLAFLQHNMAKEIRSLKAFRDEQYRMKKATAANANSMQAVDAEHGEEEIEEPLVPVPVAGCDMTCMANVNLEHELAEA